MKEIDLSICIPTYNRAERIYQNLISLKEIPNQNIEFVVIDDCSKDNTKEKVLSINDNRIKFYRNKRNLGQEANVIKTFQKASGKFVFLLSDEDRVNLESLPWILNTIKEEKDVGQIVGAIWDDNSMKLYYNPKNQILNKGPQSLIELIFNHAYISGVILKRCLLDLKDAKKYIGSSYIHLYISIPVMMRSKTICTSRIVCYIGKKEKKYTFEKAFKRSRKKILFNHPFSRLIQINYHFKIINDITRNLPKLRKYLIKKEYDLAALLIVRSCFLKKSKISGFLTLIKVLPQILQVKQIRKAPIFWKNLLNNLFINFRNRL